jgi:hypothetical protein
LGLGQSFAAVEALVAADVAVVAAAVAVVAEGAMEPVGATVLV